MEEEVKYEKIKCPVCETEQLACRRNCIECGRTLTKAAQHERVVDAGHDNVK